MLRCLPNTVMYLQFHASVEASCNILNLQHKHSTNVIKNVVALNSLVIKISICLHSHFFAKRRDFKAEIVKHILRTFLEQTNMCV